MKLWKQYDETNIMFRLALYSTHMYSLCFVIPHHMHWLGLVGIRISVRLKKGTRQVQHSTAQCSILQECGGYITICSWRACFSLCLLIIHLRFSNCRAKRNLTHSVLLRHLALGRLNRSAERRTLTSWKTYGSIWRASSNARSPSSILMR